MSSKDNAFDSQKALKGTPKRPEKAFEAAATPDIDPDLYIPRSLKLLATAFIEIIDERYTAKPGSIKAMCMEPEDGTVCIGFYPKDAVLDDTGNLDIYGDPEFFKSISALITDMTAFTVDPDVFAHIDMCGFRAPSKLALYRVLSEYLTHDDFKLTTVDTTFISESRFDPEIKDQQRQNLRAHYSALTREAYQNPQAAAEIFKTVNNSPYIDRREYEEACFVCAHADIGTSLSHILQTICQEDGLQMEDYPYVRSGQRLTYGGYH